MNIIPATLTGQDNSLICEFKDSKDNIISLIDNAPPEQLLGANKQEILFGIRPEAITSSQKSTNDSINHVKLLVDMVDPAGADTYVYVNLNENQITARLPGNTDIQEDSTFEFNFDLSSCSYFDPKTTLRVE